MLRPPLWPQESQNPSALDPGSSGILRAFAQCVCIRVMLSRMNYSLVLFLLASAVAGNEIGVMQFPEGEVQHVVRAASTLWAPCQSKRQQRLTHGVRPLDSSESHKRVLCELVSQGVVAYRNPKMVECR